MCPKCGGMFIDAADKEENKVFFLSSVDLSSLELGLFVQKGAPEI